MIFEGADLRLTGAARDVRTDASGGAEVLGEARVDAHLDASRSLERITTSPLADVASLTELHVGRGFRAAVEAAVPDDASTSSPLFLLLDELPVASLISGYALLYTGAVPTGRDAPPMNENICAGWRSDGTMMVSVRGGDGVPVPYGPPANPIETPDDPHSWHPISELPAGAMRRRRLVEITPESARPVWAMFRDTHIDPTGAETVLHEYVVTADIDREAGCLTSCTATPKVLPWPECPAAAASAERLIGIPLDEIRSHVRGELTGTSTCTHLNDLLRSLGDLPALLAALPTT